MSGPAIQAGLTGQVELTVAERDTAAALGSGLLPVLGTPAMIALMEQAACRALEGRLPEGSASVGARLDIRHLSPTPVGGRVRAEATLQVIDGRRLLFSCKAFDDAGCVGEGEQERFIVDTDRFMKKAEARRG